MPDDRAPEDELPSLSPWAVRHSLPHRLDDDEEISDAAPEDETPAERRSIFNRFRRRRPATPDQQARLLPPDEPVDVGPTPEDELLPPPLEPARSPWRRADEATAASTVTPTTSAPPTAPPFTAPAVPTRPTPPIEAMVTAMEEASVEHASTPTPQAAIEPPHEAADEVLAPVEVEAPPAPAVEAPSRVAAEPDAVEAAVSEQVASPVEMSPVAASVEASVEAPVAPAVVVSVVPPTPAPEVRAYDGQLVTAPAEPERERESSMGWAAFRPIPVPINPYMVVLSAIVTLVTLAYLLVEPSPRWYLVMGAVAVVAGLDGTLRATWRVTYRDAETTPALFMPAIFILAVPPLIEHNVRGFTVLPAGLAVGVAFFAIVAAQVGSARPGASYYPWARTVSTAGAYAAGFAFFSLTYVYDLGVGASALACGLVALMLAIEVLREGEIDSTETAGYAAAAGAAVGQWRLALHYLPVDGYLAGLAVVLGFLVVTGLLQAYITRSLDRRTTIDHAVIATAGAALVIGARVAGLA